MLELKISIFTKSALSIIAGYYLGKELSTDGVNFVAILLIIFILKGMLELQKFIMYNERMEASIRRIKQNENKQDIG